MPKPHEGETEKHYIARCVPALVSEGRKQDQAVAMCYSYWREHKEESKSLNTFSLYKSSDGDYRWCAIFTNKYRDNDRPPEILSEAAHLGFVKSVADKSWPLPTLDLWHIPGSTWGATTMIGYDRETGFTLAAGIVDHDKQAIAEVMSELPPEELGVSHGMPREEILRDRDDTSTIVRYRTKEISLLPLTAAANKLTSFTIIGGENMDAEPKGFADQLKEWLGEDRYNKVAGVLALKSKEATDAGLEFKSDEVPAETPTVPAETPAETKSEPVVAPDPTDSPITRKEIAEAITETVPDMIAKEVSTLAQVVTTLQSEVDTLKTALAQLTRTDEEKIKEQAAWTPPTSIAEIIRASVIGKKETTVDGRTKEAQGPKQTASDARPVVDAGHPLLSQVMSNIISGKVINQGGTEHGPQ